MRRLYTLLLWLALPAALAILAWRGLRQRDYWRGGAARFGLDSQPDRAEGVWIHAVSVGEVQAAVALVAALRASHPQYPVTLTCATPTGRERARQTLPAEVSVRYAPYDLPGAVRRVLARLRPRLLIIIETELWPNLLYECARAQLPVLFASARMSARSARRYRHIAGLLRAPLSQKVWVAAQTQADAQRFQALGVTAAHVRVTGNLKFDRELSPQLAASGTRLRARYAPGRAMWVAGSVHPAEFTPVLEAHERLRASTPGALLVLAPRHPERFEPAAAVLTQRAVRFIRRSSGAVADEGTQVLLLDTLGELSEFYAAADVAFVGGTLIDIGGHNLLEPAALGVPVLAGPHVHNSAEIARLLRERGALQIIHDAMELEGALAGLFADEGARRRCGEAGRAVVQANRGALARVLELAQACLSP